MGKFDASSVKIAILMGRVEMGTKFPLVHAQGIFAVQIPTQEKKTKLEREISSSQKEKKYLSTYYPEDPENRHHHH